MKSLRRRLRDQARLSSPPENPVLMRHRRFIRSLPCLACGKPAPSECAHIGWIAGPSIPTSDRYLVPLCGPATVWQDCCHSRKHYRGAVRFWPGLGIEPLDLASQLWLVSGDVTAGLRAVMHARQAAASLCENAKVSSPGCALDRGAAPRDRLSLTPMATPPMSSEHPLLLESRS